MHSGESLCTGTSGLGYDHGRRAAPSCCQYHKVCGSVLGVSESITLLSRSVTGGDFVKGTTTESSQAPSPEQLLTLPLNLNGNYTLQAFNARKHRPVENPLAEP